MDPLSDVLRVVRLDGAYFYPVEAAAPWRVEAEAAKQLLPRILPRAQHLISYHVLTEGVCFGGLAGEAMVELAPGDVIVFPHGDAHVMASAPSLQVGVDRRSSAPDRYPTTVILGEGGPTTATFVCGFLGCDLQPFNPLLASLPRQMHIRGMSSGWLGGSTRLMTDEARHDRAGASEVLTRMAELMFIEVVRRYLEELPQGQRGWLAGLRDEVVGRALALLHADPGHAWTLATLAQAVASSRSKLAERFTHLVGQPPMQYLTQWRMQVASTLLLQGGWKVASVGGHVGYDSEAAFSRAFKKSTGLAPGAWREARRSG
ncbi:MAG: AraC family transcriptional regulator [Gemmatimonadota bacterium]